VSRRVGRADGAGEAGGTDAGGVFADDNFDCAGEVEATVGGGVLVDVADDVGGEVHRVDANTAPWSMTPPRAKPIRHEPPASDALIGVAGLAPRPGLMAFVNPPYRHQPHKNENHRCPTSLRIW
jgi:hypothetical protein